MKKTETLVKVIVEPAPKKAAELVTDVKGLTDVVNIMNKDLHVVKDVINFNADALDGLACKVGRMNRGLMFTSLLACAAVGSSYIFYKEMKKLENRVIALEVKGASDDELYFSDEEKTEE